MAAIAVGGSTSEVVQAAAQAVDTVEERGRAVAAQEAAEVTAATRAEVDLIARTLCAVSRHTNLTEALLSLNDALEPAEARQRATLVLDRMRTILPHDLPEDLAEAGAYSRPWAEGSAADAEPLTGRALLYRLAVPAVYLLGAVMLVLSVVGSMTTIHYFMSR